MPSTIWLEGARGGTEGAVERSRGTPLDRPHGLAGTLLIATAGGGGNQKPAPAEFAAELDGQVIGDPGATQLIEQGHAAQADGEADEELQDGFQHARPLCWSQPRGSGRGQHVQEAAAGAMLEHCPVR